MPKKQTQKPKQTNRIDVFDFRKRLIQKAGGCC
jgi:hypothetical protein